MRYNDHRIITAKKLIDILLEIVREKPDAAIVTNQVQNLTIMSGLPTDKHISKFIGYIELGSEELYWNDEDDDGTR